MDKYMKIALNEAEKAYKKGEIPIGAVIVKNNKVIAKAHNLREQKKIASYHAEILAINKACKKNNNWRLNDCIMYITVEPCMMCCGAILQSRINKIFYGTKNENYGFTNQLKNSNIEIIGGIMEKECKKIIQDFFEKKRN